MVCFRLAGIALACVCLNVGVLVSWFSFRFDFWLGWLVLGDLFVWWVFGDLCSTVWVCCLGLLFVVGGCG